MTGAARWHDLPRKAVMIMAASAAMIVVGACLSPAQAQTANPQPPPPSNSVALVNEIQSLRAQMQQMQGEIEVLQHQLQQLRQADKDQYTDLDSRLAKLEHPQSASASSSAQPVASAPAAKPMSAADRAAAQSDFDTAFKALRDGNYVDSAREFRAFIDKYPQSALLPNAYYWLGSSYSVTKNYKVALAAFQTLLEKYPDSDKVPEAQLKVADCEVGLKDYTAARATLEAVIKAHPHTSLEKRARGRMQDIPAPSGAK